MDDYITLGALAGAIAYVFAYRLFHQHYSEVVAVGIANFWFSFCLSLIACDAISAALHRPKDRGISLAVSFSLAVLAPWVLHVAAPNFGKKLLAAVKSFNLRELLIRMFGLDKNQK